MRAILSTLFCTSLMMVSGAYAQTEELLETTETPDSELLQTDIIPSTETPLPLEQIKTFAEIFTRIKRNYVEQVTDEQLLEFAVEGMLAGLDPHSVYLSGQKYEDLNEGTTGRFGGLGMEVMMEDGFIKVIAPIDDTPASKAGVQTGDLIIRIDGQTVSGLSLREGTDMMRGEPGTEVTITILRETEAEPFDLVLERAIISTKTVRRENLSEQIGYLKITQFQTETAELFRRELKALREKEEFSGLILDLRNNPGGLLNSAVSITDAFIDEGLIVSTKGRSEENDQTFMATPSDLMGGLPVVVIINAGSASASEIVAGALQDHNRAIVLGTESFGKGSVQTVLDVGQQEAIKLTTARYYTPSGRSIQASGIVPDVLVEQREFKPREQTFNRITENDLPGHLESQNEKPNDTAVLEQERDGVANDYQLNEAFNLLKGLILYLPKDTAAIN
ncbi:MAG: S41 family peptidase [Acidiferrobacterales bacterium]|nr:S41 family peptidase [Acidiferrobacterales bacterium]